MIWRFDLIDGSNARVTLRGVEVVRSATVSSIDVLSGEGNYAVLLKLIADGGFPGIGSLLDTEIPEFKGATLQDASVITRDKRSNSVRVALSYRKAGIGTNPVTSAAWSLSMSGNISHILQGGTAGGVKQIATYYKAGVSHDELPSPSWNVKNVQMPRMLPSRVFRAQADFTADQWAVSRASVWAAVGKINSAPWGDSPRGNWFVAPPSVTTNDRNKSLTVTLNFLENPNGWFGLALYRNDLGQIPPDVATEAEVRSLGYPPQGEIIAKTGITLASQYLEVDVAAGVPFSPSDI